MKGGGGGGGINGGKRRWRGLAVAVLGLIIILSMLVPLGFLLGLHSGIILSAPTAGFASDQHNSAPGDLSSSGIYRIDDDGIESPPKKDRTSHVDALIKKLDPGISEDLQGLLINMESLSSCRIMADTSRSSVPSGPNTAAVDHKVKPTEDNKSTADESGKSCELSYGAYCLWREQHKEVVKDSLVKKLKDRLFVARAYFPSIAKIQAQERLSTELKQNIQDFERVLSESSVDSDLPPQIDKKLERMEAAIAKAKSCPVECQNIDKKFRQLLDLTEDEANFHMKQSAFLHQLAVRTIPKSHHCLSMRLTVDYFRSPENPKIIDREKYSDPSLHHIVIFSNNVLASSVVINSTVSHTKESRDLVFHVLTDRENFYAMERWFSGKAYDEVTVQVLNVEKMDLQNAEDSLSLPSEYRVSFHIVDGQSTLKMKTEYLSTFSKSHFLLPEIFPDLNKIVVLDDDVVVQRNLTSLWSLSLGGKVNGAVQSCAVRLGQLGSLLGGKLLNPKGCAWMSGLSVIDLSRWREMKLGETYRRLVQQLNEVGNSVESAAFGATVLSFQDQIHALDDSWMLSGLGHDYNLKLSEVNGAAVLHYNGNMKPWLELGIPKYKNYWKRFLNWEEQIFSDCNISP